ncbi:hypothetical protein [uncultured Rummeliibacillus sp.]|uniref:hypothetical protein n=1 Tax=uncultured Rummeliibacillus sp. TaxID=762292 RepID=UPI002623800F|nr:hypothetical protein [uncultured Rummeliibacillus sp.]
MEQRLADLEKRIELLENEAAERAAAYKEVFEELLNHAITDQGLLNILLLLSKKTKN